MQKILGPKTSRGVIARFAYSKPAFYKYLLCQTVTRLFKYPNQAFGTLDFTGKGYIEAQNIYNHALLFSTPFTKVELKDFCESHVF